VPPESPQFQIEKTFRHKHPSTANLKFETTTTNKNIFTMDSVKQGANYVSEQAQKLATGTSKEANKEVAKDSDQSLGNRYVCTPNYLRPLVACDHQLT
jgi:hypothetical protein